MTNSFDQSITPDLDRVAWINKLEETEGTRWNDEYWSQSISYGRATHGMVRCGGCGMVLRVELIHRVGMEVPKYVAACKTCFDASRPQWYWEGEDWEEVTQEVTRAKG